MKTIHEVLEEHPRLTCRGYDGDPNEENYEAKRDEIRNATEELSIALDFLSKCSQTDSNSELSYHLKHMMEGNTSGFEPYKGYVSNGVAILAALMLDYEIKPLGYENPNVLIAVKAKRTARGSICRSGQFFAHNRIRMNGISCR